MLSKPKSIYRSVTVTVNSDPDRVTTFGEEHFLSMILLVGFHFSFVFEMCAVFKFDKFDGNNKFDISGMMVKEILGLTMCNAANELEFLLPNDIDNPIPYEDLADVLAIHSELLVFEVPHDYPVPARLRCPLSGQPFAITPTDRPVICSDNGTYNLSSVRKLLKNANQVSSLQNGILIRKGLSVCFLFVLTLPHIWDDLFFSDTERVATHIVEKLREFYSTRRKRCLQGMNIEPVNPIGCMGSVNRSLEALRELLKGFPSITCFQSDATVLKIVVLGSQAHGKSSLLEQLSGLCLCPSDIDCTTKMVIELVIAPNNDPPLPSLMSVHLTRENEDAPYVESRTGRTFQTIPISAAGKQAVSNKMKSIADGVLAEDSTDSPDMDKDVVVTDQKLIISMSGPNLPRVTFIDTPGLVQSPEHMRDLTIKCVDEYVKHNPDALFLMVHDAKVDLSNSPIWDIIEKNGIQDRTLGVFTHVDDVGPKKLVQLADFVQGRNLEGDSRGCFDMLTNGWVMTMSKKIEISLVDGEEPDDRQVLEEQAVKELDFFTTAGVDPNLIVANKATVNSVKLNLTRMSQTVFGRAAPAKIEELEAVQTQVYQLLDTFGSPPAHLQFLKEDRLKFARKVKFQVKEALDMNCAKQRLDFRKILLRGFDRALTTAQNNFMGNSRSISLDNLEETICTGVETMKAAMTSHLSTVLDSKPWTSITNLVAKDQGPVKLSRFPQLVEPVGDLVKHTFEVAIDGIGKNVLSFLNSRRDHPEDATWNYSMFSWTTDIDTDSITLTWDPKFHEDCITVAAVTLSRFISKTLSDNLLNIIEAVLGENSTESCAADRIKVLHSVSLLNSIIAELERICHFSKK